MNKREFVLAGCGTLGAGLATAVQAAAVSSVSSVSAALPTPPAGPAAPTACQGLQACDSLAAWQAHAGERFVTLSATGRRQDLHLRQVQALPAPAGGESFAVVFSAEPGAAVLQAETHPLLHARSGAPVAVFLQPAGRGADGARLYRADFNRVGWRPAPGPAFTAPRRPSRGSSR